MFEEIMRGNIPDTTRLLSHSDLVEIKRRIQTIKTQTSLPPIVTHNMNDDNDEIIHHLRRCKLLNYNEDRVKIIYHPQFLTSSSHIIPVDYDQFVRGSDLGVFPSYYEPWGYTPAECLIKGVPSITSNLTGFANFITKKVSNPEENGLYIIDRRFKSFEESKIQLANIMWQFCQLDTRQIIALKNKVERLSYLMDWKILGRHYVKARNKALKEVYNLTNVEVSDLYDNYEKEFEDIEY